MAKQNQKKDRMSRAKLHGLLSFLVRILGEQNNWGQNTICSTMSKKT